MGTGPRILGNSKTMYPKADIPVMEMSLDYSPYNGWNRENPCGYYYEPGQALHLSEGKEYPW